MFPSADDVLATDPLGLAPELLGAYAVAAFEVMDRARGRLVTLLGEVDATFQYRIEGQASAASWLRKLVSVTDIDAGRLVTLARRLHRAPVIAAAVAAGNLSVARAEALVRPMGNPRVRAAFARQEQALLDATAGLDADDVVAFAKEWERRFDFDGPKPNDEAHDSRCTITQNENGRWSLSADLTVEHGSMVAAELQAIVDQLRANGTVEGDELPKGPRLRGAALAEMAARSSGNEDANAAAPTAMVIVPIETLQADDDDREVRPAKLDGTPLTGQGMRKLLCDCVLHKLVVDSRGAILRLGRSHRTASNEQRLYLAVRDGGCVFPGCHQPPSRCRVHHIDWWVRDHGRTDVERMCLLCDHHHDLIHREIWAVDLLADGDAQWTHQRTGRVEIRHQHPPWYLDAAI
jgi:hypothetical protein